MSDIALDTVTDDLMIQNGDFRLVSGADAIAQAILIRLRTVLGEWFIDDQVGVDWAGLMSRKPEAVEAVSAEVVRVIRDTDGVLQSPDAIQNFKTDFDGASRVFLLSCDIRTDDGVIRLDNVPIGFGV